MKTVLLLLLAYSSMMIQVHSQPTPPSDHLVLAMQWPYSVCNTGKGTPCLPSHPIIPPPIYRFTIHGLWPDFYSRLPRQNPPAFCDKRTYKTIQNPVLLQSMQIYWPNIVQQNADPMFWSRQWKKHGTCVVPQMNQFDYFNLALNLRSTLALERVLMNAGIPLLVNCTDNVTSIIQRAISVTPTVLCNKAVGGQLQLFEVRVCYNLTQKSWIDCPNAYNSCKNPYNLPV